MIGRTTRAGPRMTRPELLRRSRPSRWRPPPQFRPSAYRAWLLRYGRTGSPHHGLSVSSVSCLSRHPFSVGRAPNRKWRPAGIWSPCGVQRTRLAHSGVHLAFKSCGAKSKVIRLGLPLWRCQTSCLALVSAFGFAGSAAGLAALANPWAGAVVTELRNDQAKVPPRRRRRPSDCLFLKSARRAVSEMLYVDAERSFLGEQHPSFERVSQCESESITPGRPVRSQRDRRSAGRRSGVVSAYIFNKNPAAASNSLNTAAPCRGTFQQKYSATYVLKSSISSIVSMEPRKDWSGLYSRVCISGSFCTLQPTVGGCLYNRF